MFSVSVGKQGYRGLPGPKGEAGTRGPSGAPGSKGIAGPIGTLNKPTTLSQDFEITEITL